MKNLIRLSVFCLLNSCIVPPSPNRDYYKLYGGNNQERFEDGIGYVYIQNKNILNLWVYSTPWKTVYLSTSIPIKDSIFVLKNREKIFILRD